MNDDHIIKLPTWVWALRIVQISFAVIVLALSAYGVHFISYVAYCLALFASLWTILTLTYYFVALHALHAAYNWVAILVLDCLAIVFWLATWGDLAALCALWWSGNTAYTDYTDYSDYYYVKRDTTSTDTYGGVLAAAVAFSVLTWALYITTLVMFSIAIHKHRKAGMPMVAGGKTKSASYPMSDTEKAVPQANVAPVSPVASYPPQQPPQAYNQQQPQQPQYNSADAVGVSPQQAYAPGHNHHEAP